MTVREVLAWLGKHGSPGGIASLARYGIVAKRPLGLSMAQLQVLQKRIRTDQELSLALWKTGVYEAKLLAALIGDPARVTERQMHAWARDFENWADCDTACFKLFDRSPHAWDVAARWARSPRAYVKRGAFALIASLALHDKTAPGARFVKCLPLIENGARDERAIVRKGVSWALRGIGKRRSDALREAAIRLATKLAAAPDVASRWVGKDVLRDLSRPRAQRRASRKRQPARKSRAGA